MRVLIIKMSSMGDVLHTLPALSDSRARDESVRFDWIVEESFREIPAWHPAVERVIPVSLRKWRRQPAEWLGQGARTAMREIRAGRYEHVIDAQGLYKSAAVACLARGSRAGYAAESMREPLAARLYAKHVSVPADLHAVERTRRLFAGVLGYEVTDGMPDYGLSRCDFPADRRRVEPYVIFNHASTWPTKAWPETHWRELIDLATGRGLRVLLPWGNEAERAQAGRLAGGAGAVEVLPRMGLHGLAGLMAHAQGAVSVDTGLGHLAAALGTPAVSIYGATDPSRTGTVGSNQHRIQASFECAPCFSRRCAYSGDAGVSPACYSTVSPERVWGTLRQYV